MDEIKLVQTEEVRKISNIDEPKLRQNKLVYKENSRSRTDYKVRRTEIVWTSRVACGRTETYSLRVSVKSGSLKKLSYFIRPQSRSRL